MSFRELLQAEAHAAAPCPSQMAIRANRAEEENETLIQLLKDIKPYVVDWILVADTAGDTAKRNELYGLSHRIAQATKEDSDEQRPTTDPAEETP